MGTLTHPGPVEWRAVRVRPLSAVCENRQPTQPLAGNNTTRNGSRTLGVYPFEPRRPEPSPWDILATIAETHRLMAELIAVMRSGNGGNPLNRIDNGPVCGSGVPMSVSTRPLPALAAEVSTPLSEIIPAWMTWLEGRGRRGGTLEAYRTNAGAVIAWANWTTIHDLKLESAVAYLAVRRKGNPDAGEPGVSGTTNDSTVSALRSLGEFLEKTERLNRSPFRHLERSNEQGGPGSRAATTDEARALISASILRCRGNRKAKGNAPLFWCFLFKTGLRVEEAGAIRWRDIDLNGPVPRITTDPGWSKNRRREVVPLDPEILRLLIEHQKCVPAAATDPIFPITPNRHTWHEDREAANIPATDGQNEPLTQHGARKWLDTTLDETGATAGERYKIIRHRGNLDEDRYNRPILERLQRAVSRLPKLWPDGFNNFPIFEDLGVAPGGDTRYISSSALEPSMSASNRTSESTRIDRPSTGPMLTLTPHAEGRSIQTDSRGSSTGIEHPTAHSQSQRACSTPDALAGLTPAERADLLRLILKLAPALIAATLIALAVWGLCHWRTLRLADGRIQASALDGRTV